MNQVILDNIYFCLAQYDWNNDLAVKVSYLNSALNLTIGLLLREGLPRPIKVVIPRVEEKQSPQRGLSIFVYRGYEVVELTTLEKIIDLLTRELVKVAHLARDKHIIIKDGTTKQLMYSRERELLTEMSIIEELEVIKAILLQILTVAGYDKVKFASLGKPHGEREVHEDELLEAI